MKTIEDSKIKFWKSVEKQQNQGNPYFPDWEKVESFWIKEITELLESLKGEIEYPMTLEKNPEEYYEENEWEVRGYNQREEDLRLQINKILNK